VDRKADLAGRPWNTKLAIFSKIDSSTTVYSSPLPDSLSEYASPADRLSILSPPCQLAEAPCLGSLVPVVCKQTANYSRNSQICSSIKQKCPQPFSSFAPAIDNGLTEIPGYQFDIASDDVDDISCLEGLVMDDLSNDDMTQINKIIAEIDDVIDVTDKIQGDKIKQNTVLIEKLSRYQDARIISSSPKEVSSQEQTQFTKLLENLASMCSLLNVEVVSSTAISNYLQQCIIPSVPNTAGTLGVLRPFACPGTLEVPREAIVSGQAFSRPTYAIGAKQRCALANYAVASKYFLPDSVNTEKGAIKGGSPPSQALQPGVIKAVTPSSQVNVRFKLII
jgi:hypothetical protein